MSCSQPSQWHEAILEGTPLSQRKSTVASTELIHHDFTAPRYPVDSITEVEHCVLMAKCHNLTLKAVLGSVLPPRAEGTFHCRPIPHGYAIVTLDEIVEGFEDLELDYHTGEGEIRVGDALRSTCLWKKAYIKLPHWTPHKLISRLRLLLLLLLRLLRRVSPLRLLLLHLL